MDQELTQIAVPHIRTQTDGQSKLVSLLEDDLDFHGQASGYASHNFHAFPAKFPPQLPRKFIQGLTSSGDLVLDPMVGSGTTVVEALLNHRCGVGFDIDPLAVLLSRVKLADLDREQLTDTGKLILRRAKAALRSNKTRLAEELSRRWDKKTRQFVTYWFAYETQLELLALIMEIEQLSELALREFFQVVFSSVIITKSGGVSLAFDLAHTRPHRAKIVMDPSGEVLLGHDRVDNPSRRVQLLTKTLRSPLEEFENRLQRNLEGLITHTPGMLLPQIQFGDAQQLPLDNASVDLIVTSPPYMSNAIDYMRAHKFSLVWMGHTIDDLGKKRKEYIGGESVTRFEFEELPTFTAQVTAHIAEKEVKKGQVVHRYYSEMTRTLREMYRVLKPNKAAIVVVGTSVMKGIDTQIAQCLVDIGQGIGFEVPKIGVRSLDRNRRMLPAGKRVDTASQIQQRMHEEYVIGFYKPTT